VVVVITERYVAKMIDQQTLPRLQPNLYISIPTTKSIGKQIWCTLLEWKITNG